MKPKKCRFPRHFTGTILFALFLFPNISFSQLVINNAVNALDGVQTVLLGAGVTASNITFSGNVDQIGGFTCNGCNLGIANGLVLGSGNVNGAAGPNTSGTFSSGPAAGIGASDPDLFELSGNPLNDAAILEFDFIPTGDSLAFNFVFGSDEYPEFSGSSFNDAFGFFLSGPGITGPYLNNAANIALVPNSITPITINNINNGTGAAGPCTNCQYYINNLNSFNSTANQIQCDGFTTLMTARANVVCGQTYHIKIAIADAGTSDTSYDSFVFLQAGSFQSNQVALTFTAPANLSPAANGLYEGCQTGYLYLTRPPGISTAATYDVMLSGTAQNGVDVDPIPTTITFPPFEDEVAIPITAIQDNTFEGLELLQVTLDVGGCAGNTSTTFDIEINDLPELQVTTPYVEITCGGSAVLTPVVTGGIGYYAINWNTIGFGNSITVSPNATTLYDFIVTDTCGVTPFEGVAEVFMQVVDPVTVYLGPDLSVNCLDLTTINPPVGGGFGMLSYEWSDQNTVLSTAQTLDVQTGIPLTIALEITDECGSSATDFVQLNIPQVNVVIDWQSPYPVPCTEEVTISPQISGGVGNYTYTWSDGSGSLGNTADLTATFDSDQWVQVSAEDECGNTSNLNIEVEIIPVPIIVNLGPNLDVTCLDQTEVIPNISGGVGAYSYDWDQDGIFAGTGATEVFQASTASTINLVVSDLCGNSGNDQMVLNVPAVPMSVSLGNDLSLTCIETAPITANVSGGVGTYDYTWSQDGEPFSGNSTVNVGSQDQSSVQVIVEDQCGNTATDQLNIYIPAVPVSLVLSNDTVVCTGENIVLTAQISGGIGNYIYEWQNPEVAVLNLTVQPSESTSYTFEAIDQCGNMAVSTVSVLVDSVEPIFTAEYAGEDAMIFENVSEHVANSTWYFSDGTSSNDNPVIHEFNTTDEWIVELLVESDLGCIKTSSGTYYPIGNLYLPNAFTPDMDGTNDFWRAEGHDIAWFEIIVFNRWGDIVYQSKDINEVWDGSHKSGDYFIQDGVYLYQMKAQGVRGNIIEREGTITILR